MIKTEMEKGESKDDKINHEKQREERKDIKRRKREI